MKMCKLILLGCIVLMGAGCSEKASLFSEKIETCKDKYGNVTSERVMSYDKKGKLTRIEDGNRIITYEYEDGNCIQMNEGDQVVKYEYDNGRVIRSEYYLKDKLEKTVVFLYDGNGNQIQYITTTNSSTINEQTTMVYNDKNQCIKVLYQNDDGEVAKTLNQYDSEGNLVLVSSYLNEVLCRTTEHVYEDNVLVRTIIRDSEIGGVQTVYYGYDGKGNMIEEKLSNNEGQTFESTISYEYLD